MKIQKNQEVLYNNKLAKVVDVLPSGWAIPFTTKIAYVEFIEKKGATPILISIPETLWDKYLAPLNKV